MRSSAGADGCLRGLVFVCGLVLVLAGAGLWLFSSLLTAPLVLAGLWIWSWEFAWARLLQHRFLQHLRGLSERMRRRPARWAAVTFLGLASAAAGYWALVAYSPI